MNFEGGIWNQKRHGRRDGVGDRNVSDSSGIQPTTDGRRRPAGCRKTKGRPYWTATQRLARGSFSVGAVPSTYQWNDRHQEWQVFIYLNISEVM